MDSGNLFVPKSKGGCGKTGKIDEILKSYQDMSYDAINISHDDLILGLPFLSETAKNMKLPFISANMVSKKTQKPLFDPFVIKKTNKIKLAIFGIMAQPASGKNEIFKKQNVEDTDDGYMIKNPHDAARDMVARLKNKADIIIALSSLSKKDNTRLLENLSELSFVISTSKTTHKPLKVNNGHILSTGNKGKYLGQLDVKFTSLEKPYQMYEINSGHKLRSSIVRIGKVISTLKEKSDALSQSDSVVAKERLRKKLSELEQQKVDYRKKLAQFDMAKNLFEYNLLPLGSGKAVKKAPESRISSRMKREKLSLKQRPDKPTGKHIKVIGFTGDTKTVVQFMISLDKTPGKVRALGFDTIYDSKTLRYTGYTKGKLVESFDMFNVRMKNEGLLRLGGFEARDDFIPTGKSGEIVTLNFKITAPGDTKIKLVDLKDDISYWGIENSGIKIHKEEADQGELNKIQKDIINKEAEWKAGPTPISDLPPEERKKRLGIKLKSSD